MRGRGAGLNSQEPELEPGDGAARGRVAGQAAVGTGLTSPGPLLRERAEALTGMGRDASAVL